MTIAKPEDAAPSEAGDMSLDTALELLEWAVASTQAFNRHGQYDRDVAPRCIQAEDALRVVRAALAARQQDGVARWLCEACSSSGLEFRVDVFHGSGDRCPRDQRPEKPRTTCIHCGQNLADTRAQAARLCQAMPWCCAEWNGHPHTQEGRGD